LEKNAIRFWSRVQRSNNCWIWTRGKFPEGYGAFRVGKKSWRAHRFSYLLTYGDPGSLCVLHKCDNPSCVRPDHLFLGTRKDNNQDSARKGHRRGPPSCLTPSQVCRIRRLYRHNFTQRQIAKRYRISQTLVWAVVNIRIHKSIF